MRLQVLELPYDPEAVERPYILVLSECTGDLSNYRGLLDKAGFTAAAGIFVTDQKVEVGPDYSDLTQIINTTPPPAEVTQSVQDAFPPIASIETLIAGRSPETQELPVPKPTPYPIDAEMARNGG